MGSEAVDGLSLAEACEKLLADTGGRRVLVFGPASADGEIETLAHATAGRGGIDDAVGDQLASLVADVLQGAAQRQAADDIAATLGGGLGACATAVGARAALVVLFDEGTSLERVRAKVKRARDLLLRLVEAPHAPAQS